MKYSKSIIIRLTMFELQLLIEILTDHVQEFYLSDNTEINKLISKLDTTLNELKTHSDSAIIN